MHKLRSGERVRITDPGTLSIHLSGDAGRGVVAGVTPEGDVRPLERASTISWTLAHSIPESGVLEIVGYMVDDRNDVLFSDLHPATLEVDGTPYALPSPQKRLGLVIIGEVYRRDGIVRFRVACDGFAGGVPAYARAKSIDPSRMPLRRNDAGIETRPTPFYGSGPAAARDPRHKRAQIVGAGSGVLVGHRMIVTNAHVVETGSTFTCSRGRVMLDLVAVDPMHDLAILQGDVEGEPVRIRRTATGSLGEPVLAAGYPLSDMLGSDLKISAGNVSGLAGPYGDVSRFQFTAPIGSGSSGGAVLDEFGNMLGVTAASLSHDAMRAHGAISENVNFAVKASLVQEIMSSIGLDALDAEPWTSGTRQDAVARARRSVIALSVLR